MPHPHDAVHALARAHGAVSIDQVRQCGFSRGQANRAVSGWSRVVRGVYLVPDLVTDPARAMASGAVLAAPRGSVCSHTLAAALWGMRGAGPLSPLRVTAPPQAARFRNDGLVVHRRLLLPTDRALLDDLPLTSPARTLCDLATAGPAAAAICAADSALHDGVLDAPGLRRYAERWPRRIRSTLALADGRSESPLETLVRLVLLDGRLPAPELQVVVTDAVGIPYARLDLAYRRHRVGIEADGEEVHGRTEALYRDRWRQNRLQADGWLILRFTWDDAVRPGTWCGRWLRRFALARAPPRRATQPSRPRPTQPS